MTTHVHAQRIAALRAAMRREDIAACVVPSADPHLSEYLPQHWQARAWLSGFTGSAGTLVVTEGFAGLWTDSRYFEQAENQLAGSDITLMRLRVPHQPEHLEWLASQLRDGDQLAVDGACLSLAAKRRLQSVLSGREVRLRTDLDLPGQAWKERPALPSAPVYPHPAEYVAESAGEKLRRVREAMSDVGASHHLISALDEIAWLVNLRGSDVECNPVFLAHMLIEAESATLFVRQDRLVPEAVRSLAKHGVALADYDAAAPHLAGLSGDARVLLDPANVVVAMTEQLPASVCLP